MARKVRWEYWTDWHREEWARIAAEEALNAELSPLELDAFWRACDLCELNQEWHWQHVATMCSRPRKSRIYKNLATREARKFEQIYARFPRVADCLGQVCKLFWYGDYAPVDEEPPF